MSCLFSCCASLTCSGLCSSVASGVKARLDYCGLFGLSLIFSWILKQAGPSLLKWIYTSDNTHSNEWLQINAVSRVSLGNFLFFASLALIMIGVKNQNDKRHVIHHRGGTVKIVVWALLLVLMFFVPDNIISFYGTLSNFGSGLFLLVPVIILLDATNTWNDAWVERGERKWCIPLLAVFVCYMTAFTISGLMFAWFNPSGHDCKLNVFFIVMTIILAFGFVIITLQANASLLPSSVISVYCSYVLYSALSSEPRDYVCNGLNNSSKGVTTRNLILGMLTTVISILYCACRAGSSLKSGDRNPFLNFGQRKDREPDVVAVGYSYTVFHLIFAFASMHSNMLITGWTGSSSFNSELINVGWTSTWVQICTQWATAVLYVWSLVAPLYYPDRVFYSWFTVSANTRALSADTRPY
ncbi:probable serine incorporator [Papaver somniferum]|uniref:probable serine incorporator n=1 Tax=Papaver somniferum TaxID=3469 RepID=UPI000E701FFB|nr:probable serine incorporator [Papaver somniferum]